MSQESKKKHGESGVSNAKNMSFRNGGRPSNLSMKTGATSHPRMGGARMLHTMELAQLLPGFNPGHRLENAMDATISHLADWHSNTRYGREWKEWA